MPIANQREDFVSTPAVMPVGWPGACGFAPATRWVRFYRRGPIRQGALSQWLLLLTCLLAWIATPMSTLAQEKPTPSLYERVGRYDGISAIADTYLAGIRADPQFARFAGRGADSLRRAKQLLKDQLCALAGGPCTYVGRDMKTAHGGLGITAAEWATNMKYMAAALDKEKIPAQEKTEFLAIVDSLKPEIVEKP